MYHSGALRAGCQHVVGILTARSGQHDVCLLCCPAQCGGLRLMSPALSCNQSFQGSLFSKLLTGSTALHCAADLAAQAATIRLAGSIALKLHEAS